MQRSQRLGVRRTGGGRAGDRGGPGDPASLQLGREQGVGSHPTLRAEDTSQGSCPHTRGAVGRVASTWEGHGKSILVVILCLLGATASARGKHPEPALERSPAPTVGPAAPSGPGKIEAILAAESEGSACAEAPAGEAKPLQIVVTALVHCSALEEPPAPLGALEEEQAPPPALEIVNVPEQPPNLMEQPALGPEQPREPPWEPAPAPAEGLVVAAAQWSLPLPVIALFLYFMIFINLL
ncbi:unnamed protein product [Nyctereutes procyonoides]|uniref:(raccoon dog) hypothetical protein n=1 Tax=Nyctereutes procyonoides TaxID=34880 RepID=A0A811YQJ8_NYCPR|nr:unnamed protein product [Nyctereutes procyonoides]